MELTKEQLQKRRDEYVSQINQTKSDLNTKLVLLDGAIQDIDYWLAQLEREPPPQ